MKVQQEKAFNVPYSDLNSYSRLHLMIYKSKSSNFNKFPRSQSDTGFHYQISQNLFIFLSWNTLLLNSHCSMTEIISIKFAWNPFAFNFPCNLSHWFSTSSSIQRNMKLFEFKENISDEFKFKLNSIDKRALLNIHCACASIAHFEATKKSFN